MPYGINKLNVNKHVYRKTTILATLKMLLNEDTNLVDTIHTISYHILKIESKPLFIQEI